MFDKSKLIILVCGTNIKPHDSNWRECERTWIPKLRELGYNVMVSIGLPSLNNYFLVDGNIIYFKADDEKFGLVDKRLNLPFRWIVEETNYEYYMNIDSDCFVHPKRFDEMLNSNFARFGSIDYMGCSIPVENWAYEAPMSFLIQELGIYASGTSYLVSKKSILDIRSKIIVYEQEEFEWDDLVLGRAMYNSNIPLLHDGRILLHSKHKAIFPYPADLMPDITNENSYLAIQHYMNGHMEEAKNKLGI